MHDQPNASQHLSDEIEMHQIIHACHNFISISSDGTIGLIHYSIQEYFVSEYLLHHTSSRLREYAVDLEHERQVLTRTCLRCRAMESSSPFEDFASSYTSTHLQSTDPSSLSNPAFVQLFINAYRPLQYGTYNKQSQSPIQLAA